MLAHDKFFVMFDIPNASQITGQAFKIYYSVEVWIKFELNMILLEAIKE